MQRELFLPFIGTLEARCVVHDIDSPVDYRMLAEAGEAPCYFHPLSSTESFDKARPPQNTDYNQTRWP